MLTGVICSFTTYEDPMQETPIDVTDASFEQKVLRQPLPAIVAFWASWNEPSKGQAEALTEMIAEHGPGIVVARMNVDDNAMVSSQYPLPSLPCLLLIHQGKLVSIKSGRMPKKRMSAFFEQAAALRDAIETLDTLS